MQKKSVDERHKERHTNQFPTQESRTTYAEKMAMALERAGSTLLSMAEDMKISPEHLLAKSFSPNFVGMHPQAEAVIEVTCFRTSATGNRVTTEVRGRATFDDRSCGEIGFRVLCHRTGIMIAVEDNRFGC